MEKVEVITQEEWYTAFMEECRAIVVEGEFTARWSLVECYHQLGTRILEENDNFKRRKIYGADILQRVAKSIGKSHRTVDYAVSFAKQYPSLDDVPGGKAMSWRRVCNELLPKPKTERDKADYTDMDVTVIEGDMLDVIPTLGKFDLIVADPPYNVSEWEWDKMGTRDDFLSATNRWLQAVKGALNERYNLFWFCAPEFAADIEMEIRALGLPIQSRIVWHRRNMAMGSKAKNKFVDSWEMIFHCGTRELNFPQEWSDAWFDVQVFAVPQTNFTDAKIHPTQKPLGLIERLVEFGSIPGDKILDPFAGSGTTGRASSGRSCVLIEKEHEYAEIIRSMF